MRVDIDHPASFKEGVRVLLLMLRAKDGGSAKTDRKAVKKIVTQSPAEFDEALLELRGRWQENERIYSTICGRSIEKAIRIFKYRQLDADYFAPTDKESFYLDLENRWISCLKDGKASTESLFLVDLDFDTEPWAQKLDHAILELQAKRLTFLDVYLTRNGAHIITMPFNPQLVSFPVMKNSLMLWSY